MTTMDTKDYDNPEVEERWCEQQRAIVIDYLRSQGLQHGRVGEWPAWHIAPYVAVWAVESYDRPEWIGWWVICGDLPTDYISATDIEPPQHPRKAMNAIASRWLQYGDEPRTAQKSSGYTIGNPDSYDELAASLAKRANLLMEWSQDDSLWDEE